MKVLSLFIFLVFVFPPVFAEAGNNKKSWKPETLEKSRHHDGKVSTKKHYRSSKHRGYFRGKNHFFLYVDGYHVSPYVRYKQPRQKQVIIEKEVQPKVVREKIITKTRYVPVEKRPAPIYCGGETVYLRDKNTGELTIRYISPAKKC